MEDVRPHRNRIDEDETQRMWRPEVDDRDWSWDAAPLDDEVPFHIPRD